MIDGLIKKTIYLPSGGIEYAPLAFVGKPDHAYIIMRLDPSGYDSNFDVVTSTLNHYCDLPVSIDKMYMQDVNYLWGYLLTMDLVRNEPIKLTIQCKDCGFHNLVFISIDSMDVSVLNRFDGGVIKEEIFTSPLDITVGYKPRKAMANFDFGIAMNAHEDPDVSITLSYFCASQANWIMCGTEMLPKHQWSEALRSLTYVELYRLYSSMRSLTKSFGIYDYFTFGCRKCKSKNDGWLFDDLATSLYSINSFNVQVKKLEDTFRFAIEEARMPSFTLRDIFTQPIRYADQISAALREVKFQPGQVMM